MFRQRIQEHYDELTPRFRILADFILENTLDVGFLTATALARRLDIDPATVVRFSQEIGYSGYRELSREIKDYVNNKLALRYKRGVPDAEGLSEKVALLTDELSDRIISFKADIDQIVEITKILDQAGTIYVTSEGEGYKLATLWVNYLRIIGIKARSVPPDAVETALALQDIQENDIFLAFALGLNPDFALGHLLDIAKEEGLTTISITASSTLLSARKADQNLTVPAKTPAGYPSFDTFMALLSLIWQALIQLDEERSQAHINIMLEALDRVTEQKEDIVDYNVDAITRLWQKRED
jgi:DNA-binding MurR/RpiR family transcriptional regulator